MNDKDSQRKAVAGRTGRKFRTNCKPNYKSSLVRCLTGHNSRLIASVELVSALGGGWSSAHD